MGRSISVEEERLMEFTLKTYGNSIQLLTFGLKKQIIQEVEAINVFPFLSGTRATLEWERLVPGDTQISTSIILHLTPGQQKPTSLEELFTLHPLL